MELKRLRPCFCAMLHIPINRTIMELKLGQCLEGYEVVPLSIAPSWNWNIIASLLFWAYAILSIAPSWNWNNILPAWQRHHQPINRTIMELKHIKSGGSPVETYLYQSHHHGIETREVVNSLVSTANYQSHHHGIETSVSAYNFQPLPAYQSHHHGIETREVVNSLVSTANYQSHHHGIETSVSAYNFQPLPAYQSHHHGIET